ncbi:M16 family metallopeptidase [Thiobacter aerophilum]|uniref:Pitrilysin family protein n=1 Tax=Thiobacter aerophilum TaxID=3121275 RepID=A0ABV0EEK4_9BURK
MLLLVLWLMAVAAHAGVSIQDWRTTKGARVLFVENHDLPMLDVAVWFDAGSRRDEPALAGRAALVANLLQLGAGGLSEEEIARRLAAVGAELGAAFERDRAGYSLRTLVSRHEREEALGLLATILARPDFPATVVAREKERLMATLKEADTQPEHIAEKAFYKALYGTHPYALPESGEVETVARITRDDLLAFHRAHYGAATAVVVMIGDVTRDEAQVIAERLTAGLPEGSPLPSLDLPIPAPSGQQVRLPHPATQAHILMGQPGMSRLDPDYFPLLVGNYVLGGGGFDSRILKEIRQKRGLAYSAYSYFLPLAQPGPLQIGVQTKKDDAPEVLRVLRDTVTRFVAEGPTEAELAQAKNNIVLGFPLRVDSNRKILDFLGVIGFYGLPLTWLDDYPKAVARVTVAQVRDAFQRRVLPEKMITVVVGGPDTP